MSLNSNPLRDSSHQNRLGFRRRDAFVEVAIAEDAMQARLTMHPAVDEGAPLTVDFCVARLAETGVTFGILHDELADAVFRCTTGRGSIECTAARGRQAVPEIPEHIRLRQRLLAPPPTGQADGRIDFKKRRLLVLVKEGECLGEDVPLRPGQPGMNVIGAEIPCPSDAIPVFQPGKNVRSQDGRYFSTTNGHFVLRGENFCVENVLELKGDVGYESGHVEYPGDVIVRGRVNDGFHITTAGSLSCHETVDVSEILCKKDFRAKSGLIGRGSGVLRVGGRVQAKFADNCRIEALGDVDIRGGVFGCSVYTLGKFNAGEKGRFVGGELRSLGSIALGQAGKAAGTVTLIQAGVNFVAERRLEFAREKLGELSERLRGAEDPRLREKLQISLAGVNAMIEELLAKLYPDQCASIVIHGTAFPGVIVAVGPASLSLREEKKRVRFTLGADHRTLREESLTAEPRSGRSS